MPTVGGRRQRAEPLSDRPLSHHPHTDLLTLHLGILLALACAFATNLAFLYKHRGACAAPPVDIKHPLKSGAALWRQPWFAIGMGIGAGAWVLHVAAISLAPLSVVQAVLAGGLVLLAVMADRMFGFKVGRRQWLGLGLTTLGLVLLGVTLPQTHGSHASFSVPVLAAFEAGLLGLGGLLIMGPRVGVRDEHHGVMLAAAAGILFGVCNVGVKALTGIAGAEGVLALLLTPWTYVAIAGSIGAFYASARSLQDGEAVAVIAITGTAANISGIAGGILVFGDPLPSTAVGIAVQGLAFLMVIVASALTPAPVRAAHGAPAAAAA
jgi:drug/metabolite transporter (DMT)-like permease